MGSQLFRYCAYAPLFEEGTLKIDGKLKYTISPESKWNTKLIEELAEDDDSCSSGAFHGCSL